MTDRGRLRVYLGAAPGVGKTYAMLAEGRRRHGRGTDVAIGFVETYGRPLTVAAIGDLEIVPRLTRVHRGADFTEMDLDAVLDRHPEVALVDELAHTNVPGGRHEKRWQDIDELLEAGIDVITTVNVQHLESLNDVVTKITGVPQRETVPDEFVRSADQVELVDMSPEALRRRMAHGNIYGADKVDAALSHYFRVGNLTALRELALLWVADQVDEGLQRYREQHDIHGVWETRERVVVALTGGSEGETLIRRAARIADRSTGGELMALHVASSDGLIGASPATLAAQRHLVESLGGSYHSVVGDDVPTALLTFARAENATQLVVGSSRRGRLMTFLTGAGIGQTVTRLSGDIDVHMVSHEHAAKAHRLPQLGGGLSPRRRLFGAALALLLLPALTVLLATVRSDLNFTSEVLAYLLVVVIIALVGGLWPALASAVLGSLLLNYYFTPPLHQFTIAESNNALALLVFLAVAAMVSSVVDLAARRTRTAARASAEAEALSTLAGSVLRGERALPAILERMRETFGLESVTLLTHGPVDDAGSGRAEPSSTRDREWTVAAVAGPNPCRTPIEGDDQVPVSISAPVPLSGTAAGGTAGRAARTMSAEPTVSTSEDVVLVLRYGRDRTLAAEDRRLLGAFAAQAAVAVEQLRLAKVAADAAPLAEADRLRTALLAAVSHDLRTPIASAKAAVTGLRAPDIEWSAEERDELLATADESLDRLTRLVENLLDMSRLQSGALAVLTRPVTFDEVIPRAFDDLSPEIRRISIHDMDAVPPVAADPALLERVIANLVANALRHSPAEAKVTLTASALADRVELRVVDHGPGIPERDRERIFQPFQRLGDRHSGAGAGVGLGLALSRGLVEAMRGTLTPEDTPGGGLTMVVDLPAAASIPRDGTGDAAVATPVR